MLQSKLRRRSINLDTLFVVILDALIQIYSLPLYIQRRTRFVVLKTTVRQVYILITRHTIHELISTLFNHLLNIIRMKTRRHRIPNIMVSIGILLLFLCRFQKVIKHKLHVTKSLNFSVSQGDSCGAKVLYYLILNPRPFSKGQYITPLALEVVKIGRRSVQCPGDEKPSVWTLNNW